MKQKKVIITGVSGMIGSHLAEELLRRGHEVIGVDDLSFGSMENIRGPLGEKKFRFRKADICDFRALGRVAENPGIIVHLAAVKKVGEKESALPTLLVNARGTESVLRLAREKKAKVVFGSTSDVYGMSPRLPFKEDGESVLGASTARRWAYAVSKLFCEQLVLSYYKDFGVPGVILRYFGGFSERSSTTWSGGHIPIFIDAILKGKPVVIHGDGRQTRSMAHVSDLVQGTVLAMTSPGAVGEIINLGNDEEVSVLESARMIHRLSGTGLPLKIKFVPMKRVFGTYREIPRRVPDLSKAKKLLNYSPRVRFRDAILKVIETRKNPE